MEFFKDLWGFLNTRKKFWLLPIIFVLTIFGGLIILSQGIHVILKAIGLKQIKITSRFSLESIFLISPTPGAPDFTLTSNPP